MMTALSILVVDDDDGDQAMIRRTLKGTGLPHRLHMVNTADAARGAEMPGLDVVFIDHCLPGDTGLTVLPDLRRKWPQAAFVLMSGQGDEETAASAMKLGATDYVAKRSLSVPVMRRIVESGVEMARMQARLAQQRSDLETFCAVLVHDLKAPIRASAYLSQQIAEDIGSDAKADALDGLRLLRKSSAQMIDLINSLESHIRLDREQTLEIAPLPDIVARSVLALDRDITETGAEVTVDPTLPEILCIPPQLSQLFQNLIANSIKFRADATPQISVTAAEDRPESVLIRLDDNGIGVPEPYREKIFEPFKRIDPHSVVGGTGLGLATCRKIVDRHGGRIWCEAAASAGASILILLPKRRRKADWTAEEDLQIA